MMLVKQERVLDYMGGEPKNLDGRSAMESGPHIIASTTERNGKIECGMHQDASVYQVNIVFL